MKVEQPFLLPPNLVQLPLDVPRAGAALFVIVRRACPQRRPEPVADRLGLFELRQELYDLSVGRT
jgi:hypothetical protein